MAWVDPSTSLELAGTGQTVSIPLAETAAFDVRDVPPGEYLLRLRRDSPGSESVVTVGMVSIRPGEAVDWVQPQGLSFGAVSLSVNVDQAVRPVDVRVLDGRLDRAAEFVLEPGKPRVLALLAGSYVAEYATSSGAVGTLPFTVRGGGREELTLARRRGEPCRVEVIGDAVPAHGGSLLATFAASPQSKAYDLLMPALPGQKSWGVSIDLEPGVYEFAARAANGAVAKGTLVVGALDSEAIWTFALSR